MWEVRGAGSSVLRASSRGVVSEVEGAESEASSGRVLGGRGVRGVEGDDGVWDSGFEGVREMNVVGILRA